MAVPKFNGIPLVDDGAREIIGTFEPRIYVETMPGLDGSFVQTHGVGSATITVTGFIVGTGDTPREAHTAAKQKLRNTQALADGKTVAPYIGTDDEAGEMPYEYCIIERYEQTGHAVVTGPPYRCRIPVHITIIQLGPYVPEEEEGEQ